MMPNRNTLQLLIIYLHLRSSLFSLSQTFTLQLSLGYFIFDLSWSLSAGPFFPLLLLPSDPLIETLCPLFAHPTTLSEPVIDLFLPFLIQPPHLFHVSFWPCAGRWRNTATVLPPLCIPWRSAVWAISGKNFPTKVHNLRLLCWCKVFTLTFKNSFRTLLEVNLSVACLVPKSRNCM